MPGFDIDSLLEFRPPRYFCANCYAVNCPPEPEKPTEVIVCPACNVRYIPSKERPWWQLKKFLIEDEARGITFEAPIAHAQHLARIARLIKRHDERYPLMRGLLDLLCYARQFIHFTTDGISHQLLGAMKLIATRVPVRGIVSNVEPELARELKEHPNEAGKLRVMTVGPAADLRDAPLQKLVVIDGLIGIKGAVNLTLPGVRKAAKDLEALEVVTNTDEVIRLNNHLFSPSWGTQSDSGEEILMHETVPL